MMETFEKIGGTVLANACGPCIGQWKRSDVGREEANTIVSSFNRNFPGRNDGSAATLSFLTSPEIVTALAFAGTLEFDPVNGTMPGADGKAFRFTPPEAEELPAQGFVKGEEGYEAPAAEGANVAVEVSPTSQRLQLLQPFPRWDGQDFRRSADPRQDQGQDDDRPHLARRRLAPRARPPRQDQRQHVPRRRQRVHRRDGQGREPGDGETGKTFSQIARDLKARGIGWIVIGDENYGEGSSREHAAMSPRYLGAKAVIVRSFARIHETNLKKQGILPLVFTNASDYDLFEQADRVTIARPRRASPQASPWTCRS